MKILIFFQEKFNFRYFLTLQPQNYQENLDILDFFINFATLSRSCGGTGKVSGKIWLLATTVKNAKTAFMLPEPVPLGKSDVRHFERKPEMPFFYNFEC